MAFDLDAPTISLLVFGVAFAALQVWWIGALFAVIVVIGGALEQRTVSPRS